MLQTPDAQTSLSPPHADPAAKLVHTYPMLVIFSLSPLAQHTYAALARASDRAQTPLTPQSLFTEQVASAELFNKETRRIKKIVYIFLK
jgi:hypothetical protein